VLGTIFVIWLVLMVISGLAKAGSNRRKRQTILDHQYQEALRRKQQ
jgi:hypothetical protein